MCNYCSLKRIKKEAEKEGKKTEVFGSDDGGKDVFVDDKFVYWFMELGDHCVC